MPADFDVFLSHNSRDKPAVEEVAARLRERGLRVWLDKHELRPGLPWQEGLEEGVLASRSVAVFIGASGMGPWQQPEMRAFLARAQRQEIPVIPVLLPGCPDSPQLSLFLEALAWVDLRDGLTDEGISRLVWGITGTRSETTTGTAPSAPRTAGERPSRRRGPKDPRTVKLWGAGLGLVAVLLTLAAWLWTRPPETPPAPDLYAIRVQVVDPEGQRVDGSSVHASAGNEPQRTPDGWWEIEVPAAKVPAGGRITLWAEHPEWGGNRQDLVLGNDPNVQAEIRLKAPESLLRGSVVDAEERPLSGARVSRQDGASAVAVTDAQGRFELKLAVPPQTRVRLRAEHDGAVSGDEFCYAGRDSCWFALEKR